MVVELAFTPRHKGRDESRPGRQECPRQEGWHRRVRNAGSEPQRAGPDPELVLSVRRIGRAAIPFRRVPNHAIQHFFRNIVRLRKVHLQRSLRQGPLKSTQTTQRRVHLVERDLVGESGVRRQKSRFAVNTSNIGCAASAYWFGGGSPRICSMVRNMLISSRMCC